MLSSCNEPVLTYPCLSWHQIWRQPHSQPVPREESDTTSHTLPGDPLHLQEGRLHSAALLRSSSSSTHQACPENHSLKRALRSRLHRGTNLFLFQDFCCQLPNPFGRFLEKKSLIFCCCKLNTLLEGTFPGHSCLWSPLPWDLWQLGAWLGCHDIPHVTV